MGDFAVKMWFFTFCLGKLKDFSKHAMASQIHNGQSIWAKAHLDRSEEVLAKQTATHEKAEAVVGHSDHVGCQKVKSRLVLKKWCIDFLGFLGILIFAY